MLRFYNYGLEWLCVWSAFTIALWSHQPWQPWHLKCTLNICELSNICNVLKDNNFLYCLLLLTVFFSFFYVQFQVVNAFSIHRLLATSLVVSVKFHEDVIYSASYEDDVCVIRYHGITVIHVLFSIDFVEHNLS